MFAYIQAQSFLKDRRKFAQLADPLLEGNFPTKGLHQALAIAAMCLQEGAITRPLMSDVVTALQFLTGKDGDLDEGTEDADRSNSGNANEEEGEDHEDKS